jgi:P-aminobenzoate N-oxygenase AurF
MNTTSERRAATDGLPAYESKFGNWDNRAAVRSRPRRVINAPDLESQVFFPPESVPAVSHDLVIRRGPDVVFQILVRSLYQYLHFTTTLEQVAVLPVTSNISLGLIGYSVPEAMLADAFKITTDEAWHAQFCYDFTQELVRATKVSAESVAEPRFVSALAQTRRTFDPNVRHLVDLAFAVVSETLVSALLADIPYDRRLSRPVRELVSDHAADEGRHHAYFRSFLRWLWPQLTDTEHVLIGSRIPEFVHLFLAADLRSVTSILRASGLPAAEIKEIISDSYTKSSGTDLRIAARSTVRGFCEVGALALPEVYEAFLTAGLLGDE